MRTQKEILNQIEKWESEDRFFDFRIGDLIYHLTYKNAKPYLKESTKSTDWKRVVPTKSKLEEMMLEYMPFAWEKANRFRGLSACRSMDHYTAWIWLWGDEAVNEIGDLRYYEYYGKDNLVKICDFFGWDHTQWDDGVRLNSEPY